MIKNEFDFPDYSLCCPICNSPDCAEFHGYYFRKRIIDEYGRIVKNLPIARFICRKKKRTFSLLPHKLIPYCMFSIDFIFRVLECRNRKSVKEILDAILNHTDLLLHPSSLYRFEKIIEQTADKFIVTENPEFANIADKRKRSYAFIDYCNDFISYRHEKEVRGPPGLNIDYYMTCKLFLFGTPSQLRKRHR